MTLDDLHHELRDGWLDTDAYRAYESYRATAAARRERGIEAKDLRSNDRETQSPPEYGSPLFKSRAQRWVISQTLGQMRRLGTARRDGDRWYAGERAPRVPVLIATNRRRLVPLDVEGTQAAHRADTAAHVRREQVKARLLSDLNDPKVAAAAKRSPIVQRLLATHELLFEYLTTWR